MKIEKLKQNIQIWKH